MRGYVAALLAGDLSEGLSIIVSIPYWLDLAKFSGGGQLQEMRRAHAHLARDLEEDEPGIDRLQARLLAFLGLQAPVDPVALLHENLTRRGSSVVITSGDGDVCASLFNTFVVEQNPMWRRRS